MRRRGASRMARQVALRAAGAAVLLAACGGAVTDPSLSGFSHDPRPVEGFWTTSYRDGAGQTHVLDAELQPSGGRFLGRFDFFWAGRQWRVIFDDGAWDGIRIRFTTRETLDTTPSEVEWIATYWPAGSSRPARLLLTSDLFFVPIEYVRP